MMGPISPISKPIKITAQPQNLPKKFVVEDESVKSNNDDVPISNERLEEILKMAAESSPPQINSGNKKSIPEGARVISPEEFKMLQAKKTEIVKEQNSISDKEKELLEALLGFSVATKNVVLYRKGVPYIFHLSTLTDEEEQALIDSRIEQEELLKKSKEKINNADLAFIIRKQTLKYALKGVSFSADDKTTINFTIQEVLEYLNLPNLDAFFKTWGNVAIQKLFDEYSQLIDEATQELSNTNKLEDNLKK